MTEQHQPATDEQIAQLAAALDRATPTDSARYSERAMPAEILFLTAARNLMPGAVARIRSDAAEIARLTARLEAAQEALKPFAALSAVYPGAVSETEVGNIHDSRAPVTWGDLHRARKALSAGK